MKHFRTILLAGCCFAVTVVRGQDQKNYTQQEIIYEKLWSDFISFLKKMPHDGIIAGGNLSETHYYDSLNRETIRKDSAYSKYLMDHFISPRFKLFNHTLSPEEQSSFEKENRELLRRNVTYFMERVDERWNDDFGKNLIAVPLRFYADHFIYKQLDEFHQKNSFVVYNKQDPSRPVCFVLFLPPGSKMKNRLPLIFGWNLMIGPNNVNYGDVYDNLPSGGLMSIMEELFGAGQ